MKYAAEMGSGAMIYIPSFVKLVSHLGPGSPPGRHVRFVVDKAALRQIFS
jgi:hypothetical protein